MAPHLFNEIRIHSRGSQIQVRFTLGLEKKKKMEQFAKMAPHLFDEIRIHSRGGQIQVRFTLGLEKKKKRKKGRNSQKWRHISSTKYVFTRVGVRLGGFRLGLERKKKRKELAQKWHNISSTKHVFVRVGRKERGLDFSQVSVRKKEKKKGIRDISSTKYVFVRVGREGKSQVQVRFRKKEERRNLQKDGAISLRRNTCVFIRMKEGVGGRKECKSRLLILQE